MACLLSPTGSGDRRTVLCSETRAMLKLRAGLLGISHFSFAPMLLTEVEMTSSRGLIQGQKAAVVCLRPPQLEE